MKITQILLGLSALTLVAACTTTDVERDDVPVLTDSQLEQYNAQAEPNDRIYCEDEAQLGSRLIRRVCYRVGNEQVRQQAQLDWLGNWIE